MRAILVCVEYGDILNITLPYNRHHFEEVMVVTTPQDDETQRVAQKYGARVYQTRAFYHGGAHFNKWRALEEGLDTFGRSGWLALMDADILWPQTLPEEITKQPYEIGTLYGPYRYIWNDPRLPIPEESLWTHLHRYRDFEYPGYTQIFNGADPHLPSRPWHETNWTHAGGADSSFQNLWPMNRKHRLEWPVLHIGQPWDNWAGRVSIRTDGKIHPLAAQRRDTLSKMLAARRTPEGRNYAAEKL